jgi:hypothetical protein
MALSENFTGLHFKDRTPSAPFILFQMTETGRERERKKKDLFCIHNFSPRGIKEMHTKYS